jgi:penicillin-binding protein 2
MGSTERTETSDLMRIRLLLLALVLAAGVLLVKLWSVQVVNAPRYVSELDRQSMRRVYLPATRGRISDRKGRLIADNRLSFSVAIYVEELRQSGTWENTIDRVMAVIEETSRVIGLPPEVTRDYVATHVRRRTPLPLIAWRDCSREVVARWAELGAQVGGTDLYVEPVRVYPYGELLTHVLGYVGRRDAPETEERYHFYLPEMEGRDGIEQTLNERLAGRAGGRLIRVDASGFKHAEQGERASEPGKDVQLTLDVDLQRAAADALRGVVGAVVVLDPRNGNVLALCSSPRYDARVLNSTREWRAVAQDPRSPLINRAVTGRYAPGSTFKPLVALAALKQRAVLPTSVVDCRGSFKLGRRTIRCWNKQGHGEVALRKAIEQSCNPYFCQAGMKLGYRRLHAAAVDAGFGTPLGIELPNEKGGNLPNPGKGWHKGDTANISIGQGALLVTPLQMAAHCAALANGGYLYRPRLLASAGSEGELIRRMAWVPKQLELVRSGMLDVVEATTGTGKRARVAGVRSAGKTGTAQFVRGKKHGWMLFFSPVENPRYAVAMVVENAEGGGKTVAPRIRAMMETIFRMDGTLAPFPMMPLTEEG